MKRYLKEYKILGNAITINKDFKRNNRSALETIQMPNNTLLSIYHKGDNPYELSYKFKVNSSPLDDEHISYWYLRSIELLSDIQLANRSPFNFNLVGSSIVNYLEDAPTIQLDEKIIMTKAMRDNNFFPYLSIKVEV